MWQSPAPGLTSKWSKTVEVGCSCQELKPSQCVIPTDQIQEEGKIIESSWMFMSRVKILSVCDPHWPNSRRRKTYREPVCSNIKGLCQCTARLSATQNCQVAEEYFSTLLEFKPCLSTHCDCWCWSTKNNGIWLNAFLNLEPILCVQDCHFQIAQLEY